ncbi:hypothetical protein GCM10027098_39830 [Bowmanella dokdonensis]
MTLDMVRAIPKGDKLVLSLQAGSYQIERFVQDYKLEFSKELIKEPTLTLFYPKIKEYFPNSRSVYISRNPVQNIRSILNIYNLSGKDNSWKFKLNPPVNMSVSGRMILDSDWLFDSPSSGIIESLARRWNYCAEIYINHTSDFILFRYEDFKMDKLNSIHSLAAELKLPIVADISGHLHKQYQPKGSSDMNVLQFFGEENYQLIMDVTKPYRTRLGY